MYSAARKAGLERLPVIIKRRLSDEQALALMHEMHLYAKASEAPSADSGLETPTTRFARRGGPRRSGSVATAGPKNGRLSS